MKTCKNCGQTKSLNEFAKDNRGWVNPRCRICLNAYKKEYRHKSGESKRYREEIAKDRRYQDKHPEMIWRFGGKRYRILRRDKWKCQKCGMSNREHLELFGRKLTIHHVDGRGRHYQDKGLTANNDISNLKTLCSRCHGRIHGRQNRGRKAMITSDGRKRSSEAS
jgi:5-methylcytosine-specific restriction endonuclease McrA